MELESSEVPTEFTVPLRIRIRPCTEADLEALEWFGLFTEHREIIRNTYDSQTQGDMLMLLAETNGFPGGQVWLNLAEKRSMGRGCIWALRVLPVLQNLGIGSRLLRAAEEALRVRGFTSVELGVERDNPAARRLYERLGYCFEYESSGEYSYTTPAGEVRRVPITECILAKEL